MTVSDRWLLPDGVEDILPPLAGQIESLRRNIMDVCQHWGLPTGDSSADRVPRVTVYRHRA